MSNDVKLQEGHPVDSNLRPLKIGGKSSSLELSQHGDGARITGDLEATGNITGSPLTLDYDNISTSDPSVKGAVWRDGTDLKISAG
mgnify:FL=1